jgi:dihydrofolate reductase
MIHAIFAVDSYGGMGYNGTMPWPHNSQDLKNFKALTTGHVVVVGRNSWQDKNFPKPLPNRITYVATNQPLTILPDTHVISGDLRQQVLALETKHPDKIIWVIGGAQVLEQCEGVFDKLYLTHYKGSYKIDTKLNMKSFLNGWFPKSAIADAGQNFTTVIYENLFKHTKTST